MSKDLEEELEEYLKTQGLDNVSRHTAKEALRSKVEQCADYRGHSSCTECALFDSCNLRLSYWRLSVLGKK